MLYIMPITIMISIKNKEFGLGILSIQPPSRNTGSLLSFGYEDSKFCWDFLFIHMIINWLHK